MLNLTKLKENNLKYPQHFFILIERKSLHIISKYQISIGGQWRYIFLEFS